MNAIQGKAAPLPMANVDTDIIMPKRFLITITREGLADGTFADLRFDKDGALQSNFVLNHPERMGTSILIVGDNFGCGSSREHAVWGLMQLGIRAIIGTDFAGIFYDNARKNGLVLPIVSASDRDELLHLAQDYAAPDLEIDIQGRKIACGDRVFSFTMDDATREALLQGRDDTLDTLKMLDLIVAFEGKLSKTQKVHVQR